MNAFEAVILPYEEKYRDAVVTLWERSARATHHFVALDDLVYYKQAVSKIDFFSFAVYCQFYNNRMTGILGVAGTDLAMLFVDPDFIGRGFGRQLMLFALNDLKATTVEVNEQNIQAVDFYKKFGFVVYDRAEKDSEGKDYPLLKMRLQHDAAVTPELTIRLLEQADAVPYELLLDADPSRKLVDSYMAKGETYIALHNGETVAACILMHINAETTEIRNLAVAEKVQGRGIGTRMIAHAFELAKQKGYKTILIATSTPNIGPLYLYQKMGFEYDYLVKHYFDNHADCYEGELYDNGIRCNHLIVLSKKL
ncbi:MAG: GNAT family N-acetyltransferase [Cytophaga sp.]|uniref:GNAT family N-acetyltransferase n=1 Tax=Cytophaga sp. TaxID=29535 RepID=UPI003F7F3A08